MPTRPPAPVPPCLSLHLTNYQEAGHTGWQGMFDRARAADRAGIDRVVVSDHVVFGENLDAYGRPELGGTAGGRQPTGPDGDWLEPLTVLAMVGALTSHVRLMTGILLAGLRRAVVLAKTAATVDVLTDGRLELGVGVGWQRAEYEAAGLDFAKRGDTLDQTLAVCQRLWRDRAASFTGAGLHFQDLHCMPKPVRSDGVPIWVSGTLNPRVIDRIVRFGTGWIPWGPDVHHLGRGIARVREALATAGRDPAALEVTSGLPYSYLPDPTGTIDLDRAMAAVHTGVEAGVTDFRILRELPTDVNEATDVLREIVVAFRTTVGRTLPE